MKLKTFVIQGALISGLGFGGSSLAQISMKDKTASQRIESFERAAGIIESRMAGIRSCKRELEQVRNAQTSEQVRCIDHKRSIGEVRRALRNSSESQIRRDASELPDFARTVRQVEERVANLENKKWEYRAEANEIRNGLESNDKLLFNIRNLFGFLAKMSLIITAFTAVLSIKDKEDTDEKRS